jgi:hypothetical protein
MVIPALAEIQSAGVTVTPEIVAWIQEAALAIRKTKHRPSSDLIDFPAPCGGAWLYPLSFGAVAWIQELPMPMQNDVRVLAFACCHSRDPEYLAKLRGSLAVWLAVAKWVMTLKCSMAALSECVDRLLGAGSLVEIPDHTGRRKEDSDWEWGGVIKAMCTKYPSTTPEYWMWGVSQEKLAFMLTELQSELPSDVKFTDNEVNATNEFRSIVESIKAGTYGG